MAYDLNHFLKMDEGQLTDRAVNQYGLSPHGMSRAELANAVYQEYQVNRFFEAQAETTDSMFEVDAEYMFGGTYSKGEIIPEMSGNRLMPSEVALELMEHSSAASSFIHAYRHQDEYVHNELMVALRQAGVNPDDVYSHIGREYKQMNYVPTQKQMRSLRTVFGNFNSGNGLTLDPIGHMQEYYSNDEMLQKEYTTSEVLRYNYESGVREKAGGGRFYADAMRTIAAAYLDPAEYNSQVAYDNGVAQLVPHLELGLGPNLAAVAKEIAISLQKGDATVPSYSDILPQSLNDPRLNFKGAWGIRIPSYEEMQNVGIELQGVAGVFGIGSASGNIKGVTGIDPRAFVPDERNNQLNELMNTYAGDDLQPGYQDSESGKIINPGAVSEGLAQYDRFETTAAETIGKQVRDELRDSQSILLTNIQRAREAGDEDARRQLIQEAVAVRKMRDATVGGAAASTAVESIAPSYTAASTSPDTGTFNWSGSVGWRDPSINISGGAGLKGGNSGAATAAASGIGKPAIEYANGITTYNMEQGTPEWHEERSKRIPMSELARFLGKDTKVSQLDAVLNFAGVIDLDDGIVNEYNHHFDRGHKAEALGASLYKERKGAELSFAGIMVNDKWPNLGYSPDAIARLPDGSSRIVEFKSPAEAYGKVQTFEPKSKPQYLYQARGGQLIAGADGADLVQIGTTGWGTMRQRASLGRLDNVSAKPDFVNELDKAQRIAEIGLATRELSGVMGNSETDKAEIRKIVAEALKEGTVEGITKAIAQVRQQQFVGPQIPGGSAIGPMPFTGPQVPGGSFVGPNMPDNGFVGPQVPGGGFVGPMPPANFKIPHQPNYHAQLGMGSGVAPGFGIGPSLAGGGGGNGAPPNWTNYSAPNMGPNDGPQPKYDADFNDVDLTQHGAASIDGSGNKNMAHLFGNDKGASKVSEAWGFAKDYYSDISGVLDWAIKAGKELNMDFTQSANVGMTNVNQFTESRQNFEAMGLDANAARGTTATMASAAAQLAAGDPSAASSIVVGSRGLLTLNDIRTIKDPSQLAALAARRAKERGLTQQQFAGRMQLAGLANLGVAYTMSDETAADIDRRSNSIMSMEDSDAARRAHSTLLSKGMQVHPGFLIHEGYQRGLPIAEDLSNTDGVIKAGKRVMDAMSGAVSDAAGNTINAAKEVGTSIIDSGKTAMDRLTHSVMMVESGGDKLARSKISTASGSMQVLNGTATDPGYGVTPARNRSPEELERVGKDYLAAMIGKFGTKAGIIAYTSGPGSVERRMAKDPTGWMDKLTAKERDYLAKVEKHYGAGLRASTQGANADHFAKGPGQTASNGQLKVTVDINGNTAKTNVAYNNKSVKKKDVNLNPGGQYDTAVG